MSVPDPFKGYFSAWLVPSKGMLHRPLLQPLPEPAPPLCYWPETVTASDCSPVCSLARAGRRGLLSPQLPELHGLPQASLGGGLQGETLWGLSPHSCTYWTKPWCPQGAAGRGVQGLFPCSCPCWPKPQHSMDKKLYGEGSRVFLPAVAQAKQWCITAWRGRRRVLQGKGSGVLLPPAAPAGGRGRFGERGHWGSLLGGVWEAPSSQCCQTLSPCPTPPNQTVNMCSVPLCSYSASTRGYLNVSTL